MPIKEQSGIKSGSRESPKQKSSSRKPAIEDVIDIITGHIGTSKKFSNNTSYHISRLQYANKSLNNYFTHLNTIDPFHIAARNANFLKIITNKANKNSKGRNISACEWSPDGHYIIAMDKFNSLRIWDANFKSIIDMKLDGVPKNKGYIIRSREDGMITIACSTKIFGFYFNDLLRGINKHLWSIDMMKGIDDISYWHSNYMYVTTRGLSWAEQYVTRIKLTQSNNRFRHLNEPVTFPGLIRSVQFVAHDKDAGDLLLAYHLNEDCVFVRKNNQQLLRIDFNEIEGLDTNQEIVEPGDSCFGSMSPNREMIAFTILEKIYILDYSFATNSIINIRSKKFTYSDVRYGMAWHPNCSCIAVSVVESFNKFTQKVEFVPDTDDEFEEIVQRTKYEFQQCIYILSTLDLKVKFKVVLAKTPLSKYLRNNQFRRGLGNLQWNRHNMLLCCAYNQVYVVKIPENVVNN